MKCVICVTDFLEYILNRQTCERFSPEFSQTLTRGRSRWKPGVPWCWTTTGITSPTALMSPRYRPRRCFIIKSSTVSFLKMILSEIGALMCDKQIIVKKRDVILTFDLWVTSSFNWHWHPSLEKWPWSTPYTHNVALKPQSHRNSTSIFWERKKYMAIVVVLSNHMLWNMS